MKKILKYTSSLFLGMLARAIVRRYRPQVVMITGSVGKTSTKDAVAAVLATRFFVRKSEKSFNSEFGVPFTIFGVENPWHNPFAWVTVIRKALALILLPNHYPTMLVLEVGSGKPGDLAQILRIVTPDAVVVTRLPEIPVHVEAYASPDAVREEEFSPAYALPASAPLIVSANDDYAITNALRTQAHVISYGTADNAAVQLSHIEFDSVHGAVRGMCAHVKASGKEAQVSVAGSVGTTQLYPIAAAIATGAAFGLSLTDAITALDSYEPPAGRGRLLKGVNGSVIIDDSYNSSPAAVEKALETLKAFPKAKRRIAVLGDMLELGRYSVLEHERIGSLAADSADMIVSIGIRARAFGVMAEGRREVLHFDNSRIAAQELPGLVREGDVVLVKGSQSVRTERVVEALLEDLGDAFRLVRQERAWKRKA